MTRAFDRSLLQAALLANLANANLLINSFHAVSQEVAQGTGVTSGKYPADQFCMNAPLGGAYANQVATPFPSQPDISLGLRFTAPNAQTVAAGDISQIYSPIEGTNLAQLRYGAANARPVTVAFMWRATYTGVAAFALVNHAGSLRSFVHRFAFTANQDTFICFTIPGDQAAALLLTNLQSLTARWIFTAGTTYQTASLDTWVPGLIVAPTDITNMAATANQAVNIGACVMLPGKVNLTQDQLPLLNRRYEDDLRLCQRYYEAGNFYTLGSTYAANQYLSSNYAWKVTKRITPSVVVSTTSYSNVSGNTPSQYGLDGTNIYTMSAAAGNASIAGSWNANSRM